jgi:putative ABC transport system ATP-binding protein
MTASHNGDGRSPAAEPVVQAQGLCHAFGSGDVCKHVLSQINLTLLSGELVIMTGPSGSGKTTLLTLIGGLRTVQTGSLRVLGRELRGVSPRGLTGIRRDIGFIFQAHNLLESLTAYQNVRMALELRVSQPAELHRRATEILTRLGLGDRLHYRPKHLSGGQRQRVAIARALVNEPRLVLADEPTAALDKVSGREVVELLRGLARSQGSTILVVTHDSRIIDQADRIVNIVDGGIASEVLTEEAVQICEFLLRCPVFQQVIAVRCPNCGAERKVPDPSFLGRKARCDRCQHKFILTPTAVVGGEGIVPLTLPASPELLTQIARKMRKEQFAAGACVVEQGEPGERFYVVRSGELEVLRKTDGAAELVAALRQGDYFGEAALLTGNPRNATVRTIGEVVLYSLRKDDFIQALQVAGSFDNQIRRTLFGRLD